MKKTVYFVILIITTLIYLLMLSIGVITAFDGEAEAWLIIIPSVIGLVGAFIVFKKNWYGVLVAIIPAVFSFINCFTDNGWKNDFPEITMFFTAPLVLLLAIIPLVNKLKHEPKKVKTITEIQNAEVQTSKSGRISYAGTQYAVLLLFAAIAQIALFFLPWLKLERDVHPYMFYEIPKMSDEALWRFSDDIFIIPNIFLWATVVALTLAIIFQFAEIISVFLRRTMHRKLVKYASFFTMAECICAILMFVTFWIFLFFGFFPRAALIIMPIAFLCQKLFVKKCRSSENSYEHRGENTPTQML